MKHPEGRITARIRSDRLLGCSSTATGAGDAGRNTPTSVRLGREPAHGARPRPHATQVRRNGGLTNHFSRKSFPLCAAMNSGGCFEQGKTRYQDGQVLPAVSRNPLRTPIAEQDAETAEAFA